MDRYYPRLIRIACLALLGVVLLQLSWLAAGRDPLTEIQEAVTASPAGPQAASTAASTPPVSPPLAAAAGPAGEAGKPGADIPERYSVISESGIFGALPRNVPQPTLLGLAGRYALLLAPDGKTDLVAEGQELGGMKLLRIGTNRVLILYQGKERELTIFSGLGSDSFLPGGKEKGQ